MPDKGLTLRKGREFDAVFRTGLRSQGDLVRLLLKDEGRGLRVGYAVGKRQGKAHVRVRGRRILREAFRHLAPWIKPVTLVLLLKDKGLGAKATEVYHDLARLLDRKGLLSRPAGELSWDAAR